MLGTGAGNHEPGSAKRGRSVHPAAVPGSYRRCKEAADAATKTSSRRSSDMLIGRKPDILPSEITPQELYAHRREFIKAAGAVGMLAGVSAAGLFATAAGGACRGEAAERAQERVHGRRGADLPQGRHHLQQLLRVRHRQGRSERQRAHAEDPARGPSRSRAKSRSRRSTTSRNCSSSRRWKSASTACAAWRAGRWSFPGSAIR